VRPNELAHVLVVAQVTPPEDPADEAHPVGVGAAELEIERVRQLGTILRQPGEPAVQG
jgi:hypothetical protein